MTLLSLISFWTSKHNKQACLNMTKNLFTKKKADCVKTKLKRKEQVNEEKNSIMQSETFSVHTAHCFILATWIYICLIHTYMKHITLLWASLGEELTIYCDINRMSNVNYNLILPPLYLSVFGDKT